ncbi:MAG: deoxyuridine 5'-triphosphate nucleotidohydrolase [Clostridia bacterium]|nr:deoxyuridine 5'-triphosphate nucleotidohydrolase [Clostridia bacterium]
MQRVAEFQKVSMAQFSADFFACFSTATPKEMEDAYKAVRVPKRATTGSAGYDFQLSFPLKIASGESIKIPTGLCVKMMEGWVLLMMPKSGLGTKYRLQLDNTVGVIDSDYFYAKNEGHILIQMTNDSKESKLLQLKCGDAFTQGVFVPFGITKSDETSTNRVGGFGSTGE